jgi:DNA recombination protein RmuC
MDYLFILLILAASAVGGYAYARWRAAAELRDLEVRATRAEAERDAAGAVAAQLRDQFKADSAEALKHNNESFLALARQSLEPFQQRATHELEKREKGVETLVKPLTEALARANEQIAALEKQRAEAYGGLLAQVRQMQESQALLGKETRNLVNALRRPEARGRWGENTLKNVVELAGMVEHCDFDLQRTAGDAALRPDMVVRMPGSREIVVDAKAPLDAYLDAHEAADDAGREAALQRHAKQVRERMRNLSSKEYARQFKESPDFVVLFVPGDHFLSAAFERDPQLQDDALRNRVVLASPSSLMALLKVIAFGWRQQQLAANAQEIRAVGEELVKRLAVFAGHLDDVGGALDKAVRSHNAAIGSYESRLLPGAKRFIELGVETKAALPEPAPVDALARRPADAEEPSAKPE